jgi:hypothetical protein
VSHVAGHELGLERACIRDHLPARVSTWPLSWKGAISGKRSGHSSSGE